ncbi:tetratricopeptide repeat protein [Diaphorobacter caeni]|uniref:tetratricopeptide repeat protein n=1 Tax=Diaphorobacter caeni TaxID=2784387 RepID=UPI002B2792AB|nr:tetratricopeptide repeat protein [Diaphorobacter caeni]
MAAAMAMYAHVSWAQTPASPESATALPTEETPSSDDKAAVDAELFYELLVGEMTTGQGDTASGYALMLDAARRSGQEQLYQRATQIALQSRSAESALIAARAWKDAFPNSRDANRYLLQILVILNRTEETTGLLKQELALSNQRVKLLTLRALPQVYGRVSDKALAAKVVESAVAGELSNPGTGPAAWTAIGRMRLAADDTAGAMDAAKKALDLDPNDEGAGTLALQLVDVGAHGAHDLLRKYLAGQPSPEVRMNYARFLLQDRRNEEAREQLTLLTKSNPELADAWLVRASLDVQGKRPDDAKVALQHYITLSEPKADHPAVAKALSRAYLMAAQIEADSNNLPQSQEWLTKAAKVAPGDFSVSVQQASLLAKQGDLPKARALIQSLPSNNNDELQRKLLAEAQVLKEAKQFAEAVSVVGKAATLTPNDNDLVYEQAMLSEKAGDLPGMERLLRKIIDRQPDYYHARNALGYSLADRGVQLDEARSHIDAALKAAPEDPFILDSKGWVEFRLGNKQEAVQIFEKVFTRQQDAEIAAHYGEVLWSLGHQDKAREIWRKGQESEPDNETLVETLKRLGVQL